MTMSSDIEKELVRPKTSAPYKRDFAVGGKLDPALQQRNRLGKAFISRMRADFQKHGIATIEKVRKEKPEVYLNIVSRLVPQALEVNVQHSFTDVLLEAARRYNSPDKNERIIESTFEEVIEE